MRLNDLTWKQWYKLRLLWFAFTASLAFMLTIFALSVRWGDHKNVPGYEDWAWLLTAELACIVVPSVSVIVIIVLDRLFRR